jgi:hypothetical protein
MTPHDDDHDVDRGLQPVTRRTSPPLWIGGWALGLGIVIAIGVIGTVTDTPPPPLGDIDTAVPSEQPATPTPAATTSPTPPQLALPRVPGTFASPPPFPTRPPLGEDGLVGGLVFGTNWPPEP